MKDYTAPFRVEMNAGCESGQIVDADGQLYKLLSSYLTMANKKDISISRFSNAESTFKNRNE